MRVLSKTTNINFVGHRRLAVIVSVLILAISVGALFVNRLNLGIDFTGGVLLEMGYPGTADIERIRSVLRDGGYADVQVQNFGTSKDVLVRLPPQEGVEGGVIRDELTQILTADEPDVQLRRVDFVGPQVGEELTEKGWLAAIFTLIMIFVYVMIRFQWKFAAGAVAALVHDVIITVGFFAVFKLQFDLTVLAAVLAVIGYSLNDTVVAFDRIRENFLDLRGIEPPESINISINQMLARTIITGVTTLLVLVALFFLGGETIRPFSIALIVGVIIGTYSSVYVASATALALNISTEDLLPPQVDDSAIDDLP